MLIDTLDDRQPYHKSTLLECLKEAKAANENAPICSSYKTIMRRERARVAVYINVVRDPVNGWRMYTGRQIRKIVAWELEQRGKNV